MKRSLTNIAKWFSSVGNIAKTVGTVISLTIATIGGIKGYNAYVIRHHDKIVKQEVRDKNIETVLVKIDSLNFKFGKLQNTQSDIAFSVNQLNGSMKIMKGQLGNHIVNTATKEDIKEWMRVWEDNEQKKSMNYLNEIQLEQKEYWIPLVLK